MRHSKEWSIFLSQTLDVQKASSTNEFEHIYHSIKFRKECCDHDKVEALQLRSTSAHSLGIRTEKEVSINASGMMKSMPCHKGRQKRILHRETLTTIVGTPVEKTGEAGFIEE